MSPGRLLGLDYGTKHIGLACTDQAGVTVRPLPSVRNRGNAPLVRALREIVRRHEICGIVVGMPYNMDGSRGEASRAVEKLRALLECELRLPLTLTDERLSTVEAQQMWKTMRVRQRRKYNTVDSLAAALILERHLREG